MTDNEIIKAFECCTSYKYAGDCKDCPLKGYNKTKRSGMACMNLLDKEVKALIQRQQERIERLKDNLDAVLKERSAFDVDKIVERLKIRAYETADWMCGGTMKAVELTDAIEIVMGVNNDD